MALIPLDFYPKKTQVRDNGQGIELPKFCCIGASEAQIGFTPLTLLEAN